ncbi:MAG: hypothetical protein DRP88_04305 [Candidatus Neomarinimicrobiota bacterium]|nr:MAG: hypothetical protein DRP88_04305 [Candidatus Neomarinimicrobiota bacterium]
MKETKWDFHCPFCDQKYSVKLKNASDDILNNFLTEMVKNYIREQNLLNKVEVYCTNCKRWFKLSSVVEL